MQRNRTSWVGRAALVVLAAVSVPIVSGWLIVTLLAVGVDS